MTEKTSTSITLFIDSDSDFRNDFVSGYEPTVYVAVDAYPVNISIHLNDLDSAREFLRHMQDAVDKAERRIAEQSADSDEDLFVIWSDEEGAWWNNDDGWHPTPQKATRFTVSEMLNEEVNLPFSGEWVNVKDIEA